MASYWIATTVCIILQGNANVRQGSVLTLRVVFGVLVGAGLGGLGARSHAARQLLPTLVTTPATPPAAPTNTDDA